MIYRACYVFAGASGCWGRYATHAQALKACVACDGHFGGLAQVWVEEGEA